MAKSVSRVQQFLQWTIVPIVCSVGVGFLYHQDDVFSRTHSAFQFLWTGVVASVFYYLLVFVRQRDAWIGAIVLFGLTLLTTGSTRPASLVRDAFYFGAVIASIRVYFLYFRNDTPANPARSAFLLGGLYGILYVVAAWMQIAVMNALALGTPDVGLAHIALSTASYGLLIGFAVGAGIAINERFFGAKQGEKDFIRK